MYNPLENFKNPWDLDGEFAQSFLNLDKVLNVDTLLNNDINNSNTSNTDSNTPKPTHFINVVVLPNAQKNTNFDIDEAIKMANSFLRYYLSGYEHLYHLIQFQLYKGQPKQMRNCIVIGQDEVELKPEILKYTSNIFFTACSTLLDIKSNLDTTEVLINGATRTVKKWYPETSSNGSSGGYTNNAVIRLDHVEFIDKNKNYNPLTYQIPYQHNTNMCFILLHVIGHNALKEDHTDALANLGIMAGGNELGNLLAEVEARRGTMLDDMAFEEHNTPMYKLMSYKPNNLDYLKIEGIDNVLKSNESKTAATWRKHHGTNGRYIYGIFKMFKP